VGGTREIVEGDHGIIVPPRDPEALSAAILELANSPEQRRAMAVTVRRRFAAEFDIRVWVTRLREVYEEVLASEH